MLGSGILFWILWGPHTLEHEKNVHPLSPEKIVRPPCNCSSSSSSSSDNCRQQAGQQVLKGARSFPSRVIMADSDVDVWQAARQGILEDVQVRGDVV